jgi:hypothetical protein
LAANHSIAELWLYLIEYVDKILNTRGIGDVCAMTAAKSRLEHFPEKWAPVFGRKCDQIGNLERW